MGRGHRGSAEDPCGIVAGRVPVAGDVTARGEDIDGCLIPLALRL